MRSLLFLSRAWFRSHTTSLLVFLLGLGLVPSGNSAQASIVQVTHFKASANQGEDQFGTSVAIDGNTLVVGRRPSSGAGSGVVFRRTPAGWVQEAMLNPDFPDSGDRFGDAVAVSGDLVAIGAPNEDGGALGIDGDQQLQSATGTDSGAVYIFARQGSTWSQTNYIKASSPNQNDNFGAAVALEGDRLLVGASWEQTDTNDPAPTVGLAGSGRGAAYVFTRGGASWTQEAYVKASVPSMGFGAGVAMNGDTFVVGASLEPDPLYPSPLQGEGGAAYVFAKSAGVWSQQAQLKPSQLVNAGGFGSSVAVDGNRIAVCALHASGNKGAVTLFDRTGTSWTEQAWVVSPVVPVAGLFAPGLGCGLSVALQDDSVFVGAFLENGGSSGVNGDETEVPHGNDSGAVYHYRFAQGILQLESYIKASNPEVAARFGRGVALHNDRLFVGAPGESSASTGINGDQTLTGIRTGAVYEFDLDGPDASAIVRTAGSNPTSFTSTAPALGSLWQGSVDLTTTGHSFALMAFFLQPTQVNLGQPDQWLLVGPQFPSGELFGLAPAVGPNAQFQLNVPALTTLIGLELHAQAFHFGGVQPIVCSNALDLLIGN